MFNPQLNSDPGCFRVGEDRVNFFHEHGYITGVRVLSDEQVEILQKELADLTDPTHPGHELFYEYHSNESQAADHILFHALGAWRITAGFHDLLWNPAFTIPVSQLLGGPVRFWHDSCFANLRIMVRRRLASRLPTGCAHNRGLTLPAGSAWTTPLAGTGACSAYFKSMLPRVD